MAPKELKRFNQLRAVTLTADLGAGLYAGRCPHLPGRRPHARCCPQRRYRCAGTEPRIPRGQRQSLALVFLLALGFIYLVLAAQFESFRDPLIIMLTVPLSMTGALLCAVAGAAARSTSTRQIGLVTLVGLITKHGILIVEFANQLQEQGRNRVEAVIEAAGLAAPADPDDDRRPWCWAPCRSRIATGAGAESRQQIGWVIVGGMLVGTLFTLFVIPAVYTYVSRRVFIEADDELTPDTSRPALPAPQPRKPRAALEPAE